MLKEVPKDQPLVRVTDDEIRCQKCHSKINEPGLDPRLKWLCDRCNFGQRMKRLLRPRVVYPNNHIPFVKNMPRSGTDWKSLILGGK